MKVAIIADDLTGAADAALPFARLGFGASVTTSSRALDVHLARDEVVGVDLGTRSSAGPVAYLATVIACQQAVRAGAIVYKKVDSQLRGNPGVEVVAALDACPQAIAVVAPTLPATGRVVRQGQLQGPGVKPVSLRQLFAGAQRARLCQLELEDLRAGSAPERLASLCPGSLVLADAVGEDDLSALVDAARATHKAVVWVGSAGLAGALAGRLLPMTGTSSSHGSAGPGAVPPSWRRHAQPLGSRGVLLLIATRESISRQQATVLAAHLGAVVSELVLEGRATSAWLSSELPALRFLLAAGGTVALCSQAPEGEAAERHEHARLVVAAALALMAACPAVDLVATGGQTARCLLDALGEQSCRVVGEVEPGMPHLCTERDGIGIVTKAGSFGAELSLVHSVQALRRWREQCAQHETGG